MKGMKFSILILFLIGGLVILNAQNSVSVNIYPNTTVKLDYESFNIKDFQSKFFKSGSLDYAYTEANGTQIRVTCQRKGQPIQVYMTPPAPAIYRIFKEFYPNGRLKEKGVYLPLQLRVGQWLQCDTNGNCHVYDYESSRRSFVYNDLLKLLEEDKYMNAQSGFGDWAPAFWYSPSSKEWGVKLNRGDIEWVLTIDATTGEIATMTEFDLTVSDIQINENYIQAP